jgi:hypothetical protein
MSVAAGAPKQPAQGPLEGEDIETEHWEDARHWMSIYDDLIRFKLGLLERVKRGPPKLHPVAQKAAKVDVTFIENQMAGYYDRLDLWYQRVWKLQGLWLDPNGRVLRHKGKEAVLTQREFELLQFLLDHPHRFSPKKSATTFPGSGRSWLGWKSLVNWSIAPVVATLSHFATLTGGRGALAFAVSSAPFSTPAVTSGARPTDLHRNIAEFCDLLPSRRR